MKLVFVAIWAIMLVACAPIIQSPNIFDAQWRGEIISLITSAGVFEFAAPLSSASHDVTTSVQITEIDGRWYIWGAGKPQNEIYRITH
jgi:hypothetical protein